MKSSNLFKQLFIIVAILSFANCSAQSYFPLISTQNEERFYKIISFFDTINVKQKIALLLDTAFNNKIDSFRNTWYSKYLSAFRESIIYSDKTDKEIIRFTWLRTFHNPVVIGLVNNNGVVSIYWKKSNNKKGDYLPGSLTINKKKQIKFEQWNEIVQKLEKSNFWEIPTSYPDMGGNDGAQWILEAKFGNKYHVVDRWSGSDSEIRQFCLDLLKETNLKIKKSEIY
jgi:hypothetical protein